jgi:hypothetical protein
MSARWVWQAHLRGGGTLCVVALLSLSGDACFRRVDVSKLHCLDNSGCPSDHYCTNGHCVAGQSPVDGSNADLTPSSGLDGQSGFDGMQSSGGAGGSALDGGLGGAGGGMVDSSGGGGASGGTSGTGPQDAPGATGGATSVPDAAVAPDAPDAPVVFANGTPCTTDGQCSSGQCIDGVCCATTCTGCNACSNAMTGKSDGTCAAVASGYDPHDKCTDEAATKPCGDDGTCDGKGACRKVGAGQKCGEASCGTDGITFTPAPTCDGNGTCVAGTAQSCSPHPCTTSGCATTCAGDSDCVSGYYCASGTCVQKLSPGSVCTPASASQCSGGACVDGHCCSVSACGTCQSCTGAGGTCVAVTNDEDPDSCTGARTCNASGACKKKTGQGCAAGTECLTGNCADDVCCNTACNGSCEYCNGSSPGTCSYINGAAQTGHPACAGSGLCQGTCNGTRATCTFPGAETTCRQPSCNATTGVATNPAVCDGQGACPALTTTNCTPYVCGTTSCLTSCSGVSQCVSGLACINNACQSCPAGQTLCGNVCVNLQGSDRNNCGVCGRVCPCVNGVCVECTSLSDCAAGYQNCTANKCVCRQPSATNSMPDAGLDSAANFSVWNPSNSDVTWSSFDADGCPGSGSLVIQPGQAGGVAFTQGCLAAGPNRSFGFKYYQDQPNATYCYLGFFSDASCVTATSGYPPPTLYTTTTTNNWESVYMGLPSGTNSMIFSCFFPAAGATVYFDQFFLNTSNSY